MEICFKKFVNIRRKIHFSKRRISGKFLFKFNKKVVKGLKALHEFNIMHRDMKSANVFLFKDFTAKLGDLNVSKIAKKGLNYTQTGTPYYARFILS